MSGASGSIPVGSTVPAPGSGPILTKAELKVCRGCILGENYGKKLKVCQSCHSALYCGRECQTANWPAHKTECKELYLIQKLAQETHGDAGALSASRLSQWIARVVPILYTLMTVCLDKSNRDTHIILLTIERVEKKPYFKVQYSKVMSLDEVAVRFPSNRKSRENNVQDRIQEVQTSHEQEKYYAYGLIMITCSNDKMLPTTSIPLCSPFKLPQVPVDILLRTFNE